MAEPTKDIKDRKPLEVGDVVTLNSGGANMTVCRVISQKTPGSEPCAHVSVSWEHKDGSIQSFDFPSDALKVVSEVTPAKPEAKPVVK